MSQLLEDLEWDQADHPARRYAEMMVTEELLEMTGSACLLVALLYAERALRPEVAEGRAPAAISKSPAGTHAPNE